MNTAMLIEIFGYIGSVLVVVSMLMSSVVKLRIINTIGSVVSGIYALICGAFPLVLMNSCLIIINVYNLYKLLKSKQQYDLIESKADDSYVNHFLKYYENDIKQYFPGFSELQTEDRAYIVCCNGNPAGILLGKQSGDVIDVVIDYSTPTYRDCSVGNYLYSELPERGVNRLVFGQQLSETHKSYIGKMGFVKENDCFIKAL